MLSSKISSSQGALFDPLLTRQAEQNKTETSVWIPRPEPELASGVKSKLQ